MTDDPGRRAIATHLAAEGAQAAAAVEVADREARRAEILARYGNEAAALAPCLRERDLAQATWRLVMRGSADSGPSLMGWRDGPAETLPPEVRREVSNAIRQPATIGEALAEDGHWRHRAEVCAILGGPDLPVWVRARRAFLEARLRTLYEFTPPDEIARQEEDARAEIRSDQEPDDGAPERSEPPAGAGPAVSAAESPSPEPGTARASGSPPTTQPPDTVQSGQGDRTREEARAAVRALLGEDLTDREIARRVGVSPSTVAAVRKRPA